MSNEPFDVDLPEALRKVGRALCRRCPNCGSGPIFSRWLVMRRSCPGCHLILDRGEPDYFLGGFVINFVAAELVVVLGGLVAVLATWPDVPWTAIEWALLILMVPVPVLFYPWAKALWLAVDLVFRPATLGDLDGHGENTADPAEERG